MADIVKIAVLNIAIDRKLIKYRYTNTFIGGKNLMEGARISRPLIYDTIAGRQ